jgi:hypothetical protein
MRTRFISALFAAACCLAIPLSANGPGRGRVADAPDGHRNSQRGHGGHPSAADVTSARPCAVSSTVPPFPGFALPPPTTDPGCVSEAGGKRRQQVRVRYLDSQDSRSNHARSSAVSDHALEQRSAQSIHPAAQGLLRVFVPPSDAQVYVDGYYAGSAGALDLAPGSRQIEVRALSYEALRFKVKVEPNQTITYRGDMEPLPYKPLVETSAGAAKKTLYVIPGCYAGDRPPQVSALASGCDIGRLHTIASY